MNTEPREEDKLKIRDEILSACKWGEVLFSDKGYDAVVQIAMDFEYCYTENVPILIGSKHTPAGISISKSKWIFFLVSHTKLCLDNTRESIYFCLLDDLKSFIRTNYSTLQKQPPNVLLSPEQFKSIFKPF